MKIKIYFIILLQIDEKNIFNKETFDNLNILNGKFSKKNKDWKMINLKIYDQIPNQKPFCLTSLKFYSIDKKKTEKIIFFRDIENIRSYYSWKILNINAEELEKDEITEDEISNGANTDKIKI